VLVSRTLYSVQNLCQNVKVKFSKGPRNGALRAHKEILNKNKNLIIQHFNLNGLRKLLVDRRGRFVGWADEWICPKPNLKVCFCIFIETGFNPQKMSQNLHNPKYCNMINNKDVV
jgi:hypothetical protein